MKVNFSNNEAGENKVIVFPIFSEHLTKDGLNKIQDHLGALYPLATGQNFKAKSEQTVLCYTSSKENINKVVFLGLGESKDFSDKIAEHCGGSVAARFMNAEEDHIIIDARHLTGKQASHLAFGFYARNYGFDSYKSKKEEDKNKKKIETLNVLHADAESLQSHFDASVLPVLEGMFMARDLVNEPANILYPEKFMERCLALHEAGLKVSVLDEAEMEKLGMNALLGVGQGSRKQSYTVIMEWNGGEKDEKPVAFVGKGVCFDTGGISLKPREGMWDMVMDMGGAAAVTGAMYALAKRKAKANVVGIIGLVENMPDGNAQRPGDVVTSASGQTIEVLNTDAEGRLVLCDLLWYVQKNYTPKQIIDLATLTGAIIVSLGYEYAGIFSNNDALAGQIKSAGEKSHEPVWQLPIGESYNKKLKSRIADMANISTTGGDAGSITAACFLQRFIENDTPWCHIDIAGTAWIKEDKPTTPKGGSGYGARLLNRFIADSEN